MIVTNNYHYAQLICATFAKVNKIFSNNKLFHLARFDDEDSNNKNCLFGKIEEFGVTNEVVLFGGFPVELIAHSTMSNNGSNNDDNKGETYFDCL